jgi:hypothetical protein
MTLAELLGLIEQPVELLPREAVEGRFNEACRIAYQLIRQGMNESKEEWLVQTLVEFNSQPGTRGAVGSLLGGLLHEYIVLQKEDPEKLHADLIQAMDIAVIRFSAALWKQYDTDTKQSTEIGAPESPKAPG